MALRCSCPQIIAQRSLLMHKKSPNKVFMGHKSTRLSTNNKTSKLQITSSISNKVFEDQARGIVCYQDENGEIVCEGFDEGPRVNEQDLRIANNQKEIEIIEMLRRSCLQIAEEDGLKHAAKSSISAIEDVDWIGFRRC
ncbi:hypothetical protein MKW98_015086 [Papaver atlanticum]|uniref:Uncharacterized protein n=1 Tax=Papaver atlanticum TaxID=357466 RepID=A0AAD4S9F3_9MAGN|nr:hypothetical protein MKW98_015086 [Papaver atlanticum]